MVVGGTSSNDQECNSLIGGAAKDVAENFDARGWRYLQSQCNQFTKQKGIMQQMENSQMIQFKGRCLSTRDSSSGGVLRPPHRFEEDINSWSIQLESYVNCQATCEGCEGLLLWVSN